MAITTVAHPELARITVGVDTHGEVHVAHAKDELGRRLATVSVPTTPHGYAGLLAWARGLGQVEVFGVEGTGSYGAGLARFLHAAGQLVLEVNRPDRSARRRHGKSDPLDAEAAARAVQAGEVTVIPKTGDGIVEMIRSLRVVRATAVKARTQASNALKGLLVTAPAELREQLRELSTIQLVRAAARLTPGTLDTGRRHAGALRTSPPAMQPSPPSQGLGGPNWTGSPPRRSAWSPRFGVGPEVAGRAAGGRWRQPKIGAAAGRLLAMLCGSLAHPGYVLGQDDPSPRAVTAKPTPPGISDHVIVRLRRLVLGLPGPPDAAGAWRVQTRGDPLLEALRRPGDLRSAPPAELQRPVETMT
jgi:hypothetical protein